MARQIRLVFGMVSALLFALTAYSPAVIAADTLEPVQLAFVEYYDEAELEEIELGAVLYPGRGHDQATSVWRLRFDLGVIDPKLGWVPFGTGGRSGRLKSNGTVGVRLEHMVSRYVGAELGILNIGKLTARVNATGSGSAELSKFSPFSLGLNLHLTPNRPLDLYVGAQITNINGSRLQLTTDEGGSNTTTPVASSIGWGLSAGADIPLGRRGWLAHVGMRYLHFPMDYETAPARQESFSAYVIHAGLGYRF